MKNDSTYSLKKSELINSKYGTKFTDV